MSSLKKLTITVNTSDLAWVNALTEANEISVRELFRRLVADARQSKWRPATDSGSSTSIETYGESDSDSPELCDSEDPKDRFLFAVKTYYDINKSLESCNLDYEVLELWMECLEFKKALVRARDIYVANVEYNLVGIGKGKIHGNTNALEIFLKANKPNYGAAKKSSLDVICNDVVDSLATHCIAELGRVEGGLEAWGRAIELAMEDIVYFRQKLD